MTGPIHGIEQTGRILASSPVKGIGKQNHQSSGKIYSPNDLAFEKLLQEQLDKSVTKDLQFSKHAAARVEQRGIQLTEGLLDGLKTAVDKARDKGARDVVVIGQQGAFIVNVPNNTVVTTMSPGEMKDNIFTNIDSAVIM